MPSPPSEVPARAWDPEALRSALGEPMPALDGLRGLAISLVMVHNLALDGGHPSAVSKAVNVLLDVGWIGVTLFFVLSGFLITGILRDSVGAPRYFRAFYMRRFLRIFPLYYGVLALAFLLLSPLLRHLGREPVRLSAEAAHQGWYWLYVSNWAGLRGIKLDLFGHFWSLAVEEQFYLLWPWVVAFTSARQLARISAGLVIVACLLRVILIAAQASPDLNYHLTPTRFDALALGGLVALAAREPGVAHELWAKSGRWIQVAAAVILLVFVTAKGFSRRQPLVQSAGYFASAALFALLLYRAITDGLTGGSAWHRFLGTPLLRTLGRYSYGLYVFHVPLNELSLAVWPLEVAPDRSAVGFLAPMFLHMLVVALASFAVAFASYHLVEARFLKLKRHFEAGHSQAS